MLNLQPLRVLIVDDSSDDAELMIRTLRRHGYALEWLRVVAPDTLLAALGAARAWDLIACDSTIPLFGAERILAMAQAHAPAVPILLVSGHRPIELAGVLHAGNVRGFVSKDCLSDLPIVIDALGVQGWIDWRIVPKGPGTGRPLPAWPTHGPSRLSH